MFGAIHSCCVCLDTNRFLFFFCFLRPVMDGLEVSAEVGGIAGGVGTVGGQALHFFCLHFFCFQQSFQADPS
jgi:hypothetical protein